MTRQDFRGFDLLTTAVVILDRDLRVVHCNPAAEILFGVSSRLLEGQPLFESIEPVEEAEHMLQEAVEQQFDAKRQHIAWRLPMRGVTTLDTTVAAQTEMNDVLVLSCVRLINSARPIARSTGPI